MTATENNTSVLSDIIKISLIILRKWWLILLSMIICGSIFLTRALFFLTPIYSSTAMMYVNNSKLSVSDTKITMSSADISASQSLVQTYITILTSRITLEKVIEEADLDYSYKELKGMVEAKPVDDTEVFQISVFAEDPTEACKIANTILKVLPNRISEVIDGTSAKVVDSAVTDFLIVSPEYFKHLLFGMLFGLFVMATYVILNDFLDDKIHSEQWIKEEYGEEIPLLTVIPDEDRNSTGYGRYYYRRYQKYYQSYQNNSDEG